MSTHLYDSGLDCLQGQYPADWEGILTDHVNNYGPFENNEDAAQSFLEEVKQARMDDQWERDYGSSPRDNQDV